MAFNYRHHFDLVRANSCAQRLLNLLTEYRYEAEIQRTEEGCMVIHAILDKHQKPLSELSFLMGVYGDYRGVCSENAHLKTEMYLEVLDFNMHDPEESDVTFSCLFKELSVANLRSLLEGKHL